jgi:hypothetical protein
VGHKFDPAKTLIRPRLDPAKTQILPDDQRMECTGSGESIVRMNFRMLVFV